MGKARTRSSPLNLTLDAGALIALERGDGKMIALLDQAQKRNVSFHVPAGVVGQAWRDGRRQATLARFLRTEAVHVVALDGLLARTCGELCGAAGTSDVIDASVVVVARQQRAPIITGDADDLKRLDRKAVLIEV
jgi:predicted nucleic acid-binding protein